MVLATLYNPSNMKNLPCGEPYINQRTSDYSERFTFTGKGPRKGWRTPLSKVKYREQRDEETGYGYFGARYMDYELMAMWLSVDPLADKYPGTSPYAYCAWSPIIAKDPNGMDSVRTPNGMANAGTGYKTTPDGQYLYGEGLKTKRWNPDLVIGGVVGDGLRGGYEDWDMPSDIAAYVPCATYSETNSEFLMPPILPFMASSYDLLGNENFSGNIAIRATGHSCIRIKKDLAREDLARDLVGETARCKKTPHWGKSPVRQLEWPKEPLRCQSSLARWMLHLTQGNMGLALDRLMVPLAEQPAVY